MATTSFQYKVVTEAERANIAREFLRNREESYFRATLESPQGADDEGLQPQRDQITRLQKELADLEAAADKD
jgi:hypothetical protein